MSLVDTISRLRLHLADCERGIRNAKDNHETVKAQRTAAAQPTGKNKEERDTQIACFLADDGDYRVALALYRDAEWMRDRVSAELESALDARREYEWSIRCRLADALLSRGVQSDHADPAGDVAFDDSLDEWATQGISGDLASRDRYTFSRDHEPRQIDPYADDIAF